MKAKGKSSRARLALEAVATVRLPKNYWADGRAAVRKNYGRVRRIYSEARRGVSRQAGRMLPQTSRQKNWSATKRQWHARLLENSGLKKCQEICLKNATDRGGEQAENRDVTVTVTAISWCKRL